MDDEHFQKTLQTSAGFNGDESPYGMEDCKPVTFSSFNTSFFYFNILPHVFSSLSFFPFINRRLSFAFDFIPLDTI